MVPGTLYALGFDMISHFLDLETSLNAFVKGRGKQGGTTKPRDPDFGRDKQ